MTTVHSADLDLLEHLGGSGATVHRAMVRTTGRVVVVKRAPWDQPDVAARLGREAAVLRRVQHTSLVRLLHVLEDEDGRTLVLDNAPGGSLATQLEAYGPLPAAEVADLGARLAEALAALHRAEVLHRDVHPGNVVVDAELRPVLADLDHALDRRGGQVPSDQEVVGHPDHVDHRLFSGHAPSPASDLHALATTLWTLATGTPPPRTGPERPVVLPSDDRVPPALHEALRECLRGDVAAAAASNLHAAAVHLVSGTPPVAAPPSPPTSLDVPPPPAPTGTRHAASRALVAGTGDPATRRWGPAQGPGPLGCTFDTAITRRPRQHLLLALLGMMALAVLGWLVVDGAGIGPATVVTVAVPPSACAEDAVGADRGRVLADLDGDGCSESLWLAEGVLHTPGGRYRVGQPGDVLLAGDWDGDGVWGVGLYRPATGDVFLFDSAPGPGVRSRAVDPLAAGGTPVVVDDGTVHRVQLQPDT